MIYEHQIDPAILRIGNVEFRWYGLMYIMGFLFSYIFFQICRKKKLFNLSEEEILDLIFYLFFGMVLGARIFYIIFYNLSYYLEHPLKIFFVWEGGFSFHGGLTGIILSGLFFCRIYKKSFLHIADLAVIPASMALGLGRIGNFINGELWGRPTNGQWGVIFPHAPDDLPRHPSQIYEFFKNELIFLTLLFVFLIKKDRKDGVIFSFFLMLYGFLRFCVEFIREPEIVKFGLTMGQILSIPVFVAGVLVFYRVKSNLSSPVEK